MLWKFKCQAYTLILTHCDESALWDTESKINTVNVSRMMAQVVKYLPAKAGDVRDAGPWVGKISRRRAWQLTPVFLPGEFPWTEEPAELWSIGSQSVRHDWGDLASTQEVEAIQHTDHCPWASGLCAVLYSVASVMSDSLRPYGL